MADQNRVGRSNRVEGTLDEPIEQGWQRVGGITGDTSEQPVGRGEELEHRAQQVIGKAQHGGER